MQEPDPPQPGPTHVNRSDAELVSRTLAGDTRAFDDLVTRYRERIFRVAWHMLRSPAEADDVTQEVFIRAFRSLNKFRGDAGFFTWLYRIAANMVYTHARKQTRQREIHQQAHTEGDWYCLAVKTPEELTASGEIKQLVEQGLMHLDPRFREVLVLREIEGLETAEVSEILGVPEGTVKSRLFRAHDELREWIMGLKKKAIEGRF